MAATNSERLEVIVAASTEVLKREMPLAAKSVEDFVATSEKYIEQLEKRFSGINVDTVKRAMANVKEDFTKNFNDIQKLAAQAVQTPLTGGGVSLGSGEARAAAAAAQQQAVATRAIADAAERSVAGVARLSVEQTNFVGAARAAAAAAELEARQIAAQAGQLEMLEIELKQAGAAQLIHAQAQGKVIAVSGAQRAGMQQLSYNISDIATQWSMATPPMLIFAQQGSQVVQAIGLMRQSSGGLIGFLSGPWGAVILGAVSVLGMLYTAHEKAAEAEDEHGKAADSLKEAVDRLNGASANNNHQTRQGIIDDINAAKALYAREAATRKTILAELDLQKTRLRNLNEGDSLSLTSAAASGAASEKTKGRISELDAQIRDQQAKVNAQAHAVTVGISKLVARDVGGRSDPRTAAQQKYEDTVDAAQRAFEKSGDGARYRATLSRAAAVRDASLKVLDKSGSRASDTAARRAEATRQRELSEDISFNEESRKLRHELLNARGSTAQSEVERAKIAREDIQVELEAREKKYELLVSQGKLTEAEAARLGGIAEQIAAQKRLNLKMEERSRIIQSQISAERASVDHEIAMLRIRLDMATTAKEKKEISKRILAKEQELERKVLEAIINDPTSTETKVKQAQIDLERAKERQKGERDRQDNQQSGPLDTYIKSLDQVNEAIDQIKADGLKSVEDGIVDIITGTRKMGDVFKDIANQIIADLIRIAVQQLIVKTLTSAIGFADGGEVGSSSGSLFPFLKFADGGGIRKFGGGGRFSGPGGPRSDNLLAMVSPGEFIINADSTRKWLPLIEAINDNRVPKFANGGQVGDIRMPTMRRSDLQGSARARSGIVQQFDLRGAVVTEKLYSDMQRLADDRIRAAAPEIVQASTVATQRDLRRARLG